MAIFPPQVSQADLERMCLVKGDGKKSTAPLTAPAVPAAAPSAAAPQAAQPHTTNAVPHDPKANVVRPPLAQALAEELRRFAKDEGGYSFIDWAITVSLVSVAIGFFLPDLWTMFDQVVQRVTNDVNGVAFQVQYLK